jgi:multicomponent Na+:H+ antiporter subunit C
MTELAVAILTGILFTTGVYLLLERTMIKFLIGLVLLGNATNLVVFTCSRLVRGAPPIIPKGEKVLQPPFADPLGQALILTAIVISFGVLAFTMMLIRRTYDAIGSDDVEDLIEPLSQDPTEKESSP